MNYKYPLNVWVHNNTCTLYKYIHGNLQDPGTFGYVIMLPHIINVIIYELFHLSSISTSSSLKTQNLFYKLKYTSFTHLIKVTFKVILNIDLCCKRLPKTDINQLLYILAN